MRIAVLLLVASSFLESLTYAFVVPRILPPPVALTTKGAPKPRSSTIVGSAKIIPVAYASTSAALLWRATKVFSNVEKSVLVATSALSLLNFAPSDNTRLASAKTAYKNTPPASSGRAKQERQAAKTWRLVVRIKIIGQIVGLFSMVGAKSSIGVMRGAATIMAANIAFILCGGGGSNHDDDGKWNPLSAATSNRIVIQCLLFCTVALLASSAAVGSKMYGINASIFSFASAVGALEGIPKFLAAFNKKKD